MYYERKLKWPYYGWQLRRVSDSVFPTSLVTTAYYLPQFYLLCMILQDLLTKLIDWVGENIDERAYIYSYIYYHAIYVTLITMKTIKLAG